MSSDIDEPDDKHHKRPRILEPYAISAAPIFDAICKSCGRVFAYAEKDHRIFSWFHSLPDLFASAAKWVPLLQSTQCATRLERRSSVPPGTDFAINIRRHGEVVPVNVPTAEALKAEMRYLPGVGIVFILRCREALDHEVLASIDLSFCDIRCEFRSSVMFDRMIKTSSSKVQSGCLERGHWERVLLESATQMGSALAVRPPQVQTQYSRRAHSVRLSSPVDTCGC
jgi:hypothetical protein